MGDSIPNLHPYFTYQYDRILLFIRTEHLGKILSQWERSIESKVYAGSLSYLVFAVFINVYLAFRVFMRWYLNCLFIHVYKVCNISLEQEIFPSSFCAYFCMFDAVIYIYWAFEVCMTVYCVFKWLYTYI